MRSHVSTVATLGVVLCAALSAAPYDSRTDRRGGEFVPNCDTFEPQSWPTAECGTKANATNACGGTRRVCPTNVVAGSQDKVCQPKSGAVPATCQTDENCERDANDNVSGNCVRPNSPVGTGS
jgi:hypothetical protein